MQVIDPNLETQSEPLAFGLIKTCDPGTFAFLRWLVEQQRPLTGRTDAFSDVPRDGVLLDGADSGRSGGSRGEIRAVRIRPVRLLTFEAPAESQ